MTAGCTTTRTSDGAASDPRQSRERGEPERASLHCSVVPSEPGQWSRAAPRPRYLSPASHFWVSVFFSVSRRRRRRRRLTTWKSRTSRHRRRRRKQQQQLASGRLSASPPVAVGTDTNAVSLACVYTVFVHRCGAVYLRRALTATLWTTFF